MEKIVNFKTNAQLKSIIGSELITDDNIAVLELVKNAFDAGSEKSVISFYNLIDNDDHNLLKNLSSNISLSPTSYTSSISILDYGCGMNENDITEKWLNIAYSEKKDDGQRYDRILAGNKGIGRFSCDRLGRFLTLYSKKAGEPYFKLFIDWALFDIKNVEDYTIQSIPLKLSTISESQFISETNCNGLDHGTLLLMSMLRATWNKDKILRLRRELEKFINPNQNFTKTKFDIYIQARDFPNDSNENHLQVNGIVKNKIFDQLNFRTTSISANLDNNGEVLTTTLKDRGIEIFTLKEKNIFSKLKNIDINIYYLNSYAKVYFKRQTGVRSVDFGSIFLFINGFRVPPYGDSGDDWLGLEVRKGQGQRRFLGTREIVGRIEINENNNDFEIISNRAGIFHNEAFYQLTDSKYPYGLFYKIFRRLERFVVEGISWDKTVGKIKEEDVGKTKENFKLDPLERNKQILSVINKIIDTPKADIISLNINKDFVNRIIEEQINRSSNELSNLAKQLSDLSSTASEEALEKFKEILSEKSESIEAFQNLINGLPNKIDEDRTKSKGLSIIQLNESLKKEVEKRLSAERERKAAEEELRIEKEKNTYLMSSSRNLSEDAKGLIHNIKLTASTIQSTVNNIYTRISDDSISKKNLLNSLSTIKFQASKALEISKLITRANFRTDSNNQFVDVESYINQYMSIYKDIIYEDTPLNFTINTDNVPFKRKIKVLDIAVSIDNLISNSEKAGADIIQIDMRVEDNRLYILFSDDGKGINEEFLNKPEKIFELGVTTTDGSGIGLYNIRKALKSNRATIEFLGNSYVLKGATFQIIFS